MKSLYTLIILIVTLTIFNSCKKDDDPIRSNTNTWTKTFGDGTGYSVQQTIDSGFIITGIKSSSSNGHDVFLIKTDENGIEEWTKIFGGTSDDRGFLVEQTNDGGYIITGTTISFGNGQDDVYLIKTDGSGNEQWSKTFGDGTISYGGNSLQQTIDNGYIITGYSFGGIYLLKTDIYGDSIWSKTFGGDDQGFSVKQTTDSGYIITGGGSVSDDIFLIKTDGSGNEQWSKTFGNTGIDEGRSVQQTTDGGYIITGSTLGDVYLIKTDGSGNEQWSKTFGGTGYDIGHSVKQTNDGGYVITGGGSSFGSGSLYLIKTDENGDI